MPRSARPAQQQQAPPDEDDLEVERDRFRPQRAHRDHAERLAQRLDLDFAAPERPLDAFVGERGRQEVADLDRAAGLLGAERRSRGRTLGGRDGDLRIPERGNVTLDRIVEHELPLLVEHHHRDARHRDAHRRRCRDRSHEEAGRPLRQVRVRRWPMDVGCRAR